MTTYKNLIFSSGSIRGLSYIGCLQALDERGILDGITTYVGVSAGSMISLLLYLEYTYEEIRELVLGLDFNMLKNISGEHILEYFSRFGIDDGRKMRRLIEICIEKKGHDKNITFGEAYEHYGKTLIVIGCCLNDQSKEIFSHEYKPDVSIADAIMISISIPFYYTMRELGKKQYVDGAIIDTYPIDMFRDQLDVTLGFLISCGDTYHRDTVNSIDAYAFSVYYSMSKQLEGLYLRLYGKHTIKLVVNLGLLQFKLSRDEKEDIFNIGYRETNRFFHRKKLKEVCDAIKTRDKSDDKK